MVVIYGFWVLEILSVFFWCSVFLGLVTLALYFLGFGFWGCGPLNPETFGSLNPQKTPTDKGAVFRFGVWVFNVYRV